MKLDIEQLEFIDKKLREIALAVESQFEVEFTITSLYRIGDSGVHGVLPLRAIDLRCHDRHLGMLVKDFVNNHWSYDPNREQMGCAVFGDQNHLDNVHLQVHPNTVRVTNP